MKKLLLALSLLSGVSGAEYLAKTEPLFKYSIAAAVSGQVMLADENEEGKISDKIIVRIDDRIDRINHAVAQESYKNLKEIYETKRSMYEKIAAMTTKSQTEKDTEKISLLTAKNSMESARYQMENLADIINKKQLSAQGLYVYDIAVIEGNNVAPGTKIAELHDVSGSRLVIFVSRQVLDMLDNATIIVDGKADAYRIDKVWRETDAEFISSYRVELVGPAPKTFSQIAKIEIIPNKQDK